MQIWFLTLCYFALTILVLFLDDYRLTLGFMLAFKHHLIVDGRLRTALLACGIILCVLNLAFPMYPGPAILGDFLPAILCLFIALYYARFADEDRTTYLKVSDRNCAIALLVFTLVHFLCPQLVLF